MIIRLIGFKFYWQKSVLNFANYFSQPTQNIFEILKKCKKNLVHRTFFAIKSDWFHACKLKYDLTKQHSFNFQCFGMTIQTKQQFVNYSFFFSVRVFLTDTDDSQDSREREGTIFYSTLSLSPTHKY